MFDPSKMHAETANESGRLRCRGGAAALHSDVCLSTCRRSEQPLRAHRWVQVAHAPRDVLQCRVFIVHYLPMQTLKLGACNQEIVVRK
jgi:hypothetical protein